MAAEKEKLLKELRALLKDIPEEGLQYLIKQANILLYNQKVDELNAAARRLNKPSKKESEEVPVRIERTKGNKNMILVVNNERKIMDEEELISLVKIAHSCESEKEAGQRLYTWLKRERDDIIIDTGLSPKNKAMLALYDYLKTNFSLRSGK
jgi:hypothetical protein